MHYTIRIASSKWPIYAWNYILHLNVVRVSSIYTLSIINSRNYDAWDCIYLPRSIFYTFACLIGGIYIFFLPRGHFINVGIAKLCHLISHGKKHFMCKFCAWFILPWSFINCSMKSTSNPALIIQEIKYSKNVMIQSWMPITCVRLSFKIGGQKKS